MQLQNLHGADFPRCEFLNFIKFDVSIRRIDECKHIEKEKRKEK